MTQISKKGRNENQTLKKSVKSVHPCKSVILTKELI